MTDLLGWYLFSIIDDDDDGGGDDDNHYGGGSDDGDMSDLYGWNLFSTCAVEPRYKIIKITLLYQVSHYFGKKQRNIKSRDHQNYLVIRGFYYIWPLYNEVPLYRWWWWWW